MGSTNKIKNISPVEQQNGPVGSSSLNSLKKKKGGVGGRREEREENAMCAFFNQPLSKMYPIKKGKMSQSLILGHCDGIPLRFGSLFLLLIYVEQCERWTRHIELLRVNFSLSHPPRRSSLVQATAHI